MDKPLNAELTMVEKKNAKKVEVFSEVLLINGSCEDGNNGEMNVEDNKDEKKIEVKNTKEDMPIEATPNKTTNTAKDVSAKDSVEASSSNHDAVAESIGKTKPINESSTAKNINHTNESKTGKNIKPTNEIITVNVANKPENNSSKSVSRFSSKEGDSADSTKRVDSADNEETGLYFHHFTPNFSTMNMAGLSRNNGEALRETTAASLLGSYELEDIPCITVTETQLEQYQQQEQLLQKYQQECQQGIQNFEKIYKQKYYPTQLKRKGEFYQEGKLLENQPTDLFQRRHTVAQPNDLPLQINSRHQQNVRSKINANLQVFPNQQTRIHQPRPPRFPHRVSPRSHERNNHNKIGTYDDTDDEEDYEPGQSFLNFENFKKLRDENERLKTEVNEWKEKFEKLSKQMKFSDCNLYKMQAEVYREDFERERADREIAMGKLDEVEKKLKLAEETLSVYYKFSVMSTEGAQNDTQNTLQEPN